MTHEPILTLRGRRLRRGERGLSIILVTLLLVPMMIFAAFGVDLAAWYHRAGELQRSADAAALAGAVWMPNETRAKAEALNSLLSNGFIVTNVEGSVSSDGLSAVARRGLTGSGSSFEVTLTDADIEQYFSQVFTGSPTLTRSAEAEYNLPLPLGSPLNYFGGDASRVDPGSTTTYSLAWPSPNRNPVTIPGGGCNASSSQSVGRWTGSGFQNVANSGSNTCQWQLQTQVVTSPPTGATTLIPNNVPCNRQQSPSSQNGRWNTGSPANYTSNNRHTSGTGNRQCQWTIAIDVPVNYNDNTAANRAVNRPCNVPNYGRWPSSGSFQNNSYHTGTAADGNRLCEFLSRLNSVTTPNPNPINANRSPGFWAAIEGPRTRAIQGDAYSTRCWNTNNCSGTVENAMYTSGVNRGYWYVVEVPSDFPAGSSIAINVFDAAYNPGATESTAGDRGLDSDSSDFPTQFQVYEQTNPLDFNARSQLWSSGPNTTAGSCNWSITDVTSFRAAWQNLCNISSAQAGDIYLINVQTTGTTGAGVNGYALEAVRGCAQLTPTVDCAHGGVQPALYAYSSMQMQNNNFCGGTSGVSCPPPDATFYLAEVGPQYAGRTLVMELWDPGDVSGTGRMTPMMPSASLPRPVVAVPSSICTYTSDHAPNSSISGLSTPVTSETRPSGSECTITSASSGNSNFQGLWLRIRIDIPSTYTCDDSEGVNPEVDPNSCWWGIRYSFTASANDVTTWQARIEGNPLQLIN